MTTSPPARSNLPLADGGAAVFPCTMLQRQLWAQSQSGRPHGLNVAMRWLVKGRLPHDVAQKALQSLVRRHECLRTAFREVDGVLRQIVLADCALKLRGIDLSALDADTARSRADEIAQGEALELMDPSAAPLLRATLLRLDSESSILLLTFHSLIADGWSIGLLVSEFHAAARAIESGTTPDLAPPDLQLADYALWEQEMLESGALDEDRRYWQRKLKGLSGTVIPGDRQPAERIGNHSEIYSILLPKSVGDAIDTFTGRHNLTLYGLAVAALGLLVHRVTGQAKIVFGSQVADRLEPTAEKLAGPTVNSITLVLPIDRHASLLTFALMAADEVREAVEHQQLPFAVVAQDVSFDATRPLHAINLVVQRSYSEVVDSGGGFSLATLPSYPAGLQWDINFYLVWRDEGWRMSCEADCDLYDEATAKSLLAAWRDTLEALVSAPERRVADLEALREGVRSIEAPAAPGRAGLQDGPREPIPLHQPARQVVRFNEHGTSTPLIVLNNRSVYYQLARALGENRPLTDIQTYHPDGPLDLSGYSFDDFATYAVRLIRWAQPNGPYVLGGHCIYGALAFEAARQLKRMGEEVSLVALFDTWAPGYRESMSPSQQRRRARQIRHRGYWNRIQQYRRGEITLKQLLWHPILRRLGGAVPEEKPTEYAFFEGRWFDEAIRTAAATHRPQPLDVDAVIFRSEEPLRGRLFDERMGWGSIVAGRLYKADIASAHFDMFQEGPADEIAAFVNPLLTAIESRRDA
ncbi:condensation domain-containing protein [Reyranella sp.]|uniref:condensation domain-containing protein n=1 Tax=Reyranella sp. TaxID=1929291 RepID=UPI003BA90B74